MRKGSARVASAWSWSKSAQNWLPHSGWTTRLQLIASGSFTRDVLQSPIKRSEPLLPLFGIAKKGKHSIITVWRTEIYITFVLCLVIKWMVA